MKRDDEEEEHTNYLFTSETNYHIHILTIKRGKKKRSNNGTEKVTTMETNTGSSKKTSKNHLTK